MTEQEYRKPIPEPVPETQFYWDKVREHELWIQKCNDCNHVFFYPRLHCPECTSDSVEPMQASGKGILHTYMINQRPPPGWEAEAPYAIAIVQLEEGPRMMSNIVGIENTPENLVLDMPLEVVFDDVLPDVTIPKWKPA
ncbi:MAG: Zn-ribbon domain-containing OB-fold protein [SAR202 cluster bacterium]|nr:DNA-binding protein [Chloroflexota bacterium]MDP6420982.1 Zn-ribbon domain-containing OB-fold protein [SAR202 cluster bacterium]HAL49090.1 DNA-binding protein [Dehalococcoidia bacterium]MDP6664525.1 Zn-ribbon domain-containing OB-fold protein [SAR202 cluster bacterium]MDP6800192.1 Zn-ribbon domain-containing OB-fold protein [SAR202 cluster bacterium]